MWYENLKKYLFWCSYLDLWPMTWIRTSTGARAIISNMCAQFENNRSSGFIELSRSHHLYSRGHIISHDDVIKWKHFPRYWPFVWGIHRWPVNSPHKGQWHGALMFSFDRRLNNRLSKQSRGWWLEMPSRPLWRHCNDPTRNSRLAIEIGKPQQQQPLNQNVIGWRNYDMCIPNHGKIVSAVRKIKIFPQKSYATNLTSDIAWTGPRPVHWSPGRCYCHQHGVCTRHITDRVSFN